MAAVIPQGQSVTLFAGKRKLTLKPADLDYYRGERAAVVPNCLVVCSGSIASRLKPSPAQNRQPGKIRKGSQRIYTRWERIIRSHFCEK